MQEESSSAESKVTAPSVTGRYKCANCPRVFNSTRARSGHQLAHRKERESTGKHYAPVPTVVLINCIPSDDEEVKGPVGAAGEGTGSSDDPVKLDGDNGNTPKGYEFKGKPTPRTVQAKSSTGSSQCRRANKKPVSEKKYREHHYYRQPQEQQQKEPYTRDLLGLWNPTHNPVEDGVGVVEAFDESPWMVTLDLVSRVLGERSHRDDLNLELQLCSVQYIEEVDLEFKLGF